MVDVNFTKKDNNLFMVSIYQNHGDYCYTTEIDDISFNVEVEQERIPPAHMYYSPYRRRISVIGTKEDIHNNVLFKTNTIPMKIVRVIHSSPATIVFWNDGTKTVVKAQNEPYDGEKGIAMAFVKKFYGNRNDYYSKTVKEWVK